MKLAEVFALALRITEITALRPGNLRERGLRVRIWAEELTDVTWAIKQAVASATNTEPEAMLECLRDADFHDGIIARYTTSDGRIILVQEVANDDEYIDFIAENA